MISDDISIVGRLYARVSRRAIPLRSTYSIVSDPPKTFGITFIRVAAEERVQAIAYGLMDNIPQVVTICNPLARGAHDLEPFAAALNGYLVECIQQYYLPRVWL